MASLSDDELRVLIQDCEGVYTELARATASVELVARPAERSSDAAVLEAQEAVAQHDSAIARLVHSARAPFVAFRRWREELLPRHIPSRIRDLFWTGVAAGAAALVAILYACIDGIIRHDVSSAAASLVVDDTKYVLLFGTMGLVLAYGIYTERTYPRALAVCFVLAPLCMGFLPRWRKKKEFAIDLGGIATVNYFLRNYEAIKYYYELKRRKVGSACGPSEERAKAVSA